MIRPGILKKKKNQEIAVNVVAIVICTAFLLPVIIMIGASFKTENEIFQNAGQIFSYHPTLENFKDIFSGNYSVGRSFVNSFLVALFSMLISTVIAVPAAYSMARFKVKGHSIMMLIFFVSQMLPPTLTLAPLFIMFNAMGITNTLTAPILASTSSSIPFAILTLRTYFVTVPDGLEDAALIDGCSNFKAFLKIMCPITYPGICVTAVFCFVFGWNDLIYAMTFISDYSKWPATAGMFNFMNEYGLEWNMIMSYATLLILPVVCLFILLQNYMVEGLTGGAVKG